MEIRTASDKDVEMERALLLECRLPIDGVPEELECLLVAAVNARIVGVAGLELHDGDGLMRAVAVSPDSQRRGLGSQLCDAIERQAELVGARRLFLLTETADPFFRKRGYRSVERVLAPTEIASSVEFSAVCPASAVLMVRECLR